MKDHVGFLKENINKDMSLAEIVDVFEKMCAEPIDPSELLFPGCDGWLPEDRDLELLAGSLLWERNIKADAVFQDKGHLMFWYS